MDSIRIRYGETVTLPLDTSDVDAVSATIYIGKPGENYILSKTIALTDGKGVFVLSETDTAIPLDTYYYQINVIDADENIEKYPSPKPDCDDCGEDFPKFVVYEALDVIEVS